jgi:hypothetical protein
VRSSCFEDADSLAVLAPSSLLLVQAIFDGENNEETKSMGKRIDVMSIAPIAARFIPPPFDQPCRPREWRKLGDQAGLTQFGVNLLLLVPGAWSGRRHWHTGSDEFVYDGRMDVHADDVGVVRQVGCSSSTLYRQVLPQTVRPPALGDR